MGNSEQSIISYRVGNSKTFLGEVKAQVGFTQTLRNVLSHWTLFLHSSHLEMQSSEERISPILWLLSLFTRNPCLDMGECHSAAAASVSPLASGQSRSGGVAREN